MLPSRSASSSFGALPSGEHGAELAPEFLEHSCPRRSQASPWTPQNGSTLTLTAPATVQTRADDETYAKSEKKRSRREDDDVDECKR